MVYVDKLFTGVETDSQAARVGARNGHQWCHMWADSLEELHEMADKVGMKRAWFQNKESLPHYDLVPSRRARAIKHGAIEASLRDHFRAKRVKEP